MMWKDVYKRQGTAIVERGEFQGVFIGFGTAVDEEEWVAVSYTHLDVYKRQVFLEQSQRFAFVGTDYNLYLLPGFHGTSFVVYQVYVCLLYTSRCV